MVCEDEELELLEVVWLDDEVEELEEDELVVETLVVVSIDAIPQTTAFIVALPSDIECILPLP